MSPMIPRSVCFVAVVVATRFVWPARAAAEQACPEGASPDETRDLAATAFEDGQRLYNQGNYRGAIERFQCSFRLVPHPNTLVLFAAREGSEPVESSGGSASVGPIFGDGLVGLSVGGTF